MNSPRGLWLIPISMLALIAASPVQANWTTHGSTMNTPVDFEPIFPGQKPALGGPAWKPVEPTDFTAIPVGALGSWGVGNGGDWLRLGFARARDHAATIVTRLKPESLRGIQDPYLRDWILVNRQALAADILATEHVWLDDPQPTCARTFMPEGFPAEDLPIAYPIVFSYPTCRDAESARNLTNITELLIHESVHHFGKGETFADLVALAIVDAWRSGSIDWMPISAASAPQAREKHSAVWNGEEMIIYGGHDRGPMTEQIREVFGSAAAYDPASDTWRDLFGFEKAGERYFHQAHWAEDRLLVWGGYRREGHSSSWLYEGFVWRDGSLNRFTAPADWRSNEASVSLANFPRQQSVWTGSELLVWGGMGQDGKALGGAYNPRTGQWTSDLGRHEANAPVRMEGHSVVWTGTHLIVWGGVLPSGTSTNLGAIYDPQAPAGSRWSSLSGHNPNSAQVDVNAPSARDGHAGIWTGEQMVIFSGGGRGTRTNINGTGGIFDPRSRRWQVFDTEMVVERFGHSAVWTGQNMLVYGGRTTRLLNNLGQVMSFDAYAGRWQGVNTMFDPPSREFQTAVWTGSSLIVWGGYQRSSGSLADGGIFYP